MNENGEWKNQWLYTCHILIEYKLRYLPTQPHNLKKILISISRYERFFIWYYVALDYKRVSQKYVKRDCDLDLSILVVIKIAEG